MTPHPSWLNYHFIWSRFFGANEKDDSRDQKCLFSLNLWRWQNLEEEMRVKSQVSDWTLGMRWQVSLYHLLLSLSLEYKGHWILLYELVLSLTTQLQENARNCLLILFHVSSPYLTSGDDDQVFKDTLFLSWEMGGTVFGCIPSLICEHCLPKALPTTTWLVSSPLGVSQSSLQFSKSQQWGVAHDRGLAGNAEMGGWYGPSSSWP